MATSTKVREWAAENGLAQRPARGRLSRAAIDGFNAAHPDDVYSGEIDSLPNPDHVVTVKTFREGTGKNGKAFKVPVTKTVKVADVRAWASENGHSVGKRGRLSAELLNSYVTK